jgi:hypothetical protein
MLHRHPEPIQLEPPPAEESVLVRQEAPASPLEEFAEHALRVEEELELELEARFER